MRWLWPLVCSLCLLAGCAPDPVVVAGGPTCADVEALALAIVDGRRRRQSRAEQVALIPRDSPLPGLHRGFVTSIYDWPRPIDARGWGALARAAALAAEAHCVNRPARTLLGQGGP